VASDYLSQILELASDLPATVRDARLTKLGAENPGIYGGRLT
jgi:hypothetical protein